MDRWRCENRTISTGLSRRKPMAKHRSYSIEFERQVAQEYIAAQFPVVLALLWQIFRRARDSQITFSVTHGWSAFWRGRPWLAGRRIGETSSDVGSSRFWIGWVTKHGDKCARSTCRD